MKTDIFILDDALKNSIYYLLMRSEEIQKEINRLFLANEAHYKTVASKIPLNDNFYLSLKTPDKWNVLMLHAVTHEMEAADKEVYRLFIEQLIKKSYKRIYDFAENNAFNLYAFTAFIESREPDTDGYIHELYIRLYMYLSKEKQGFSSTTNPYFETLLRNVRVAFAYPSEVNKLLDASVHQNALDVFLQLTGEKWRSEKPKAVGQIFDAIEQRVLKNNPLLKKQITRTGDTRLSYHVKPLSYLRHALSVMQVLRNDNQAFPAGIFITKEEWTRLFLTVSAGKNKGFDENDTEMLMMYALVLFTYNKAYELLEEAHWHHLLDTEFYTINSSIQQNERDRKMLRQEKEAFEGEKRKIQTEIEEKSNRLSTENEHLSRELEKAKKENEQLKKQSELYTAMQDSWFRQTSLEDMDFDEEERDENTLLAQHLKDKKVVLIGGHPKFQQKFQQAFPQVFTIAPNELQRGTFQIKQADIVLFVTNYNNHSQFNRLKALYTKQHVVFLNQGRALLPIVHNINSSLGN